MGNATAWFPILFCKKKEALRSLSEGLFSCIILHDLHRAGDDLKDSSVSPISSDILLGTEPSNDMDTAAFLQLVEILDVVSFPRDDTMPGGFNDRRAFPVPE